MTNRMFSSVLERLRDAVTPRKWAMYNTGDIADYILDPKYFKR